MFSPASVDIIIGMYLTTSWRQFKSDCHQTWSVIPLATGDEVIKFAKVKVKVLDLVGGEVWTLLSPSSFRILQPRYGCKVLPSACLSVCLSICLSIWAHMSKTTRPNFTKFSVHFICGGRDSVLSFVNDVMFPRNETNGPESKTTLYFVYFARWRHQLDVKRCGVDWNCRTGYFRRSCITLVCCMYVDVSVDCSKLSFRPLQSNYSTPFFFIVTVLVSVT